MINISLSSSKNYKNITFDPPHIGENQQKQKDSNYSVYMKNLKAASARSINCSFKFGFTKNRASKLNNYKTYFSTLYNEVKKERNPDQINSHIKEEEPYASIRKLKAKKIDHVLDRQKIRQQRNEFCRHKRAQSAKDQSIYNDKKILNSSSAIENTNRPSTSIDKYSYENPQTPVSQNVEGSYLTLGHNKNMSIVSQQTIIPDFSKSFTFQRSSINKTVSPKKEDSKKSNRNSIHSSLMQSIHDSCKIKTIELSNPIYNNHKSYILKKNFQESPEYHLDLSKEYKNIQTEKERLSMQEYLPYENLKIVQVKISRNLSSEHTAMRKRKKSKMQSINNAEDLDPKPWEAEEKHHIDYFAKDNIT